MDKVEVEAIYQQGTLKLPNELPLRDGQRVSVTIHPNRHTGRLGGLVPWRGSQADLDYLILSEDNSALGDS